MAGSPGDGVDRSEMSRLCEDFRPATAGGSHWYETKRNQRRRAMNLAFSGRDTIQSLKCHRVEDLPLAQER